MRQGPSGSANGNGDRNTDRGERSKLIVAGEATSWLPLQDRDGAQRPNTFYIMNMNAHHSGLGNHLGGKGQQATVVTLYRVT